MARGGEPPTHYARRWHRAVPGTWLSARRSGEHDLFFRPAIARRAVVGYLLAGGYGWNGRVGHGRRGRACGAIDVVTSDGELVSRQLSINNAYCCVGRARLGPGFFVVGVNGLSRCAVQAQAAKEKKS